VGFRPPQLRLPQADRPGDQDWRLRRRAEGRQGCSHSRQANGGEGQEEQARLTSTFGRHRKIMPFEPGAAGDVDALRRQAREKAARLNQHILGYGETAEREWAAAGIAAPDLPAMRKYRLERIRAELKRRDYAGALLYDPVNIRYATDSTNMQLWVAHNPTRHCFVATDGPVILFDYFSCEHLSDHSGVVDEVRPAVSWMYMYGGDLSGMRVARWAGQIADLVRFHGGDNTRLAVDHINPEGAAE